VRPVLSRIERGHALAPVGELSAMDAAALEGLRRAGILRDLDGTAEEISVSDLVRTLRALWGVESRGLQTPGAFGPVPITIGWVKDGGGEREVVLVVPTEYGLVNVLARDRPTLALVPTGRHLTPATREEHGPGATIVLEVIEEAVVVSQGRLARAAAVAPDAPSLEPPPPVAAARTPLPARPMTFAGLERWNQLRLCLINQHTIRVDLPGKKQRCTYIDLGMATAASREPTRSWEMLVAFCEDHGQFQSTRFGSAEVTKQVISRLGKELRALFGLAEKPFHDYRNDRGWKAKFDARSDLPADDV
jgi:hypothetical protein